MTNFVAFNFQSHTHPHAYFFTIISIKENECLISFFYVIHFRYHWIYLSIFIKIAGLDLNKHESDDSSSGPARYVPPHLRGGINNNETEKDYQPNSGNFGGRDNREYRNDNRDYRNDNRGWV